MKEIKGKYTIAYEYIFESRMEANIVLDKVKEVAFKKGYILIDTFYALAMYPREDDSKTGWTYEDLDKCKIIRNRDGYSLVMPPHSFEEPPEALKNAYREYYRMEDKF